MTADPQPRDLAEALRDVRDIPLADMPANPVAEVVRRIVGAEPLEVSAFNSSI
jgi:FXSXX-COOH protein